MLIPNKAQHTCHKTLTWLRVSLTCCTYVLGGLLYFSWINQHLLTGFRKKNPEMIRGGFQKMKGKKIDVVDMCIYVPPNCFIT